jgi:hypothetical protein
VQDAIDPGDRRMLIQPRAGHGNRNRIAMIDGWSRLALGDAAERSNKLGSRRSLDEGHAELSCCKTPQARGLIGG